GGEPFQEIEGVVPRRVLSGARRAGSGWRKAAETIGTTENITRKPLQTRTHKMAHFELVEKMAPNANIKVIGVGGGGGNAVAHMVNSSVDGVEFITANTDSQAIRNCGAKLQLQLCDSVTK